MIMYASGSCMRRQWKIYIFFCLLQVHKSTNTYRHIIPAVDSDGAGSARGQAHAESVSITAQLLDESFLNIGELFLAFVGSNLGVDKFVLLAEVKPHHLIIRPAIAVGDHHTGVHPPAAQVFIVNHHHTVHGGGVADVVDEVPPT